MTFKFRMFHTTRQAAITEAERMTREDNHCYSVALMHGHGYVIFSGWEDFAFYCTIKHNY